MTTENSQPNVSGEPEKTTRTFSQIMTDFWHKNMIGISSTVLIGVLFIAVFWNQMVISIYSGEHGLKWSRFSGTELDKSYPEGVNFIWPWDKMYIYNTRIQTQHDTLTILTAEGLSIEVEYFSRFFIIKDSIPIIHQTLGPNYVETFIIPEIASASMSIIGNYTPEQLYKISTLVVQSTIKYYLNKQLVERNIIIEDYLIKKITLPKIVSESIEKKMIAEQLNYEFDYKIQIEEKEKQRKEIEAEGIKQFEASSNISILKWKGLEVTSEFAKSENSKIIIMGTGDKDLPLLLNTNEEKK